MAFSNNGRIRVNVTGARGKSFSDIARASGSFGVVPSDTDAQVSQKFADYAIQENPGFQSTIPGPADNTYSTLANFKASDIARKTASLVGVTGVTDGRFNWTLGNYTGKTDDKNIIKADSTALSVGAWVRQRAGSIQYLGNGADEKPVDIEILLTTAIDIRRFGAKCDGTTDDSAAMELLVAYCAAQGWPPVLIPGPVRLTRTINIDRAADTLPVYWRIFGCGPKAGFRASEALSGPMFNSSLGDILGEKQPQSERVEWNNILFESTNETFGNVSHGGKLFRQVLNQCNWVRMSCLNETVKFSQDWRFNQCSAILWHGKAFFKSKGAYSVMSVGGKYHQSSIHAPSPMWDIGDTTAAIGVVGCEFVADSVESINGTVFKANIVSGLGVIGGYYEFSPLFCDLTGLGVNRGVNLSPSWLDPSNKTNYQILWGSTQEAKSDVGYCSGNLHDNTGLPVGSIVATGYSAMEFQKDKLTPIRLYPNGAEYSRDVTAFINGGFPDASQLEPGVSYVFAEAPFHSVKLPPAKAGIRCVVVNTSGSDFTIYPASGDRFSTTAVDASIAQVANATREYRARDDGTWYIGIS